MVDAKSPSEKALVIPVDVRIDLGLLPAMRPGNRMVEKHLSEAAVRDVSRALNALAYSD